MQRRHFIRVLGGGVVFAAGAGTAGCSASMPDDAVAAWRGPGDEPDLRRWILGWAILAPHSHNLQSWVVDLSLPGQMTLYCDPQRLLPQTDPLARQIMMSHGTFVELLDIAARERGQRAEITLFPEGPFDPSKADARPVARVRLQPDPGAARDPLFAQIAQRHTNRQPYDMGKPVSLAAWQAIADAAAGVDAGAGLRFGHTADPAALPVHRAIARKGWRIEMTTPAAILESYHWLRVGPGEVSRHRDGLSLLDPKVVWLDRLGLFDRTRAPAPDDFATTSQIKQFDELIEATPAFMWIVSDDNQRATQVRAGRAYVRAQLAATAHGVAMHPLQQALQEYPEQAQPYSQIRRLLGADSGARTVQMWARVGHAPPVDPAPRRGVQAQLRPTSRG
jgi:hypothetical protein